MNILIVDIQNQKQIHDSPKLKRKSIIRNYEKSLISNLGNEDY